MFRHGLEARAIAAIVRPTAYHGAGVAVPLLHLTDAVFRLMPVIPVIVNRRRALITGDFTAGSQWTGQERCQVGLDADGAGARAATTVRLGEGLVEVEVDRVKTHQTGRGDAENSVEIGAIVVHLTARLVNNLTGSLDVGLKQTQGVGIGDHHRRHGWFRNRRNPQLGRRSHGP